MAEQDREIGARDLIEFLSLVEEHLEEEITLVAVGGTALTLIGAKSSTLDIDFTGPRPSIDAFLEASSKEPHGYEIDTWPDGTVFMVTLPDNYLDRSRVIETGLERIELRALHPVDLIVTKIARCDARDLDDIRTANDRFGITVDQVTERVPKIVYVGSADAYEANLQTVIRECFEPV